jgi:hypothetical protein
MWSCDCRRHPDIRGGTKWLGTRRLGWGGPRCLDASHGLVCQIPPLKYQVKLYRPNSHHSNFLDCVKSRKPTITPVERSSSAIRDNSV